MRANTSYVLSDRSSLRRWWRRQPPDEDEIQIADGFTGRVLGIVKVTPGDDGSTRVQLDYDLVALSPEKFAMKWITAPPA